MKNLSVIVVLLTTIIWSNVTAASLIGDTFEYELFFTRFDVIPLNELFSGGPDNGIATIIDPEVDVIAAFSDGTNTATLSIDFYETGLDLALDLVGFVSASSLLWSFSDLDWVGSADVIADVVQTGGTALASDIEFGDDFIRISTGEISGVSSSTWSFAIEGASAVPLSGTHLLLGLGCVLLSLNNRRVRSDSYACHA